MNSADKVQYTILRSSRRRTVSLHVHPDGSVRIRVPDWLPERDISIIIEKRRSWIERKRCEMAELPKRSGELKYHDGDTLYLLGEPHRILVGDPDMLARQWDLPLRKERGLSLFPDRRLIVVPQAPYDRTSPAAVTKASSQVRAAVHRYIREEFEELLSQRLSHWSGIILPERSGPPHFTVRSMKRRWGSCHNDGTLRFALRLYCAGPDHIDYIVVHELCHLLVFDHSREFYRTVDRVLPQWKELQGELSRNYQLWQLP